VAEPSEPLIVASVHCAYSSALGHWCSAYQSQRTTTTPLGSHLGIFTGTNLRLSLLHSGKFAILKNFVSSYEMYSAQSPLWAAEKSHSISMVEPATMST